MFTRQSLAVLFLLGASFNSAYGLGIQLSFDTTACSQSDVSTNSPSDSVACVGFIDSNTLGAVSDWNNIDWKYALNSDAGANVSPTGFTGGSELGLFGFADWVGNSTGNAFKCDDENTGCAGTALSFDTSAGEINIDFAGLGIDHYEQIAVALKQSDTYAVYLFSNPIELPLTYVWNNTNSNGNGNGGFGGTNLSHVSLLYRQTSIAGDEPPTTIPLAGTLPLISLGLFVLGWARRNARDED